VTRARLAAAVLSLAAVGWPATAAARGPAELTAAFERGATLGAATVVHAELRVDPRRARSPATEIRVFYPAGVGVLSSGLGLASCTRSVADFAEVVISGPRLGGCSPNAVIAHGTARANVRLSDGQVIPEFANVAILSGEIVGDGVGLVVLVNGLRPFAAQLAYAGELRAASGPFGGALAARLPAIPALEGVATVALVKLRLAIGSRRIVYRTRGGQRYRPEGVILPARCPPGGFRFRAQVAFEDGGRAMADTAVPCPPRAPEQ
jgi:hypothetical protein